LAFGIHVFFFESLQFFLGPGREQSAALKEKKRKIIISIFFKEKIAIFVKKKMAKYYEEIDSMIPLRILYKKQGIFLCMFAL
jgi:hypothetical protein